MNIAPEIWEAGEGIGRRDTIYCAMVMSANLLNRLRNETGANIPPIHELPSLAALGRGDLTLGTARDLAENTKDQNRKMRRLLSG